MKDGVCVGGGGVADLVIIIPGMDGEEGVGGGEQILEWTPRALRLINAMVSIPLSYHMRGKVYI